MNDLQERQWGKLLELIEDGCVIPVVGPEAVLLPEDGKLLPVDQWISNRLIRKLDLSRESLPQRLTLNDVVAKYMSEGGDRQEVYSDIFTILKPDIELSRDHALRGLAAIKSFNLFVSLTCDSLLAKVINDARHPQRVQSIAYAPNNVRDIPAPLERLSSPVVFHLLGKACCAPEFVTCEEDLLEFLYSLQDRQRQPELLFDALREHHLLILGCGLNDWVARFFLRTSRNAGLSQVRSSWETLVSEDANDSSGLTIFLKHFSSQTRVVGMTASVFVNELARRWRLKHPVDEPPPVAPSVEESRPAMSRGAIFISYASENRDAAVRIANVLSAHKLDVWFDRERLVAGDDWNGKIRQNVERCSLFVPVISRESVSDWNFRRYFWREWNDASEIAHGMAGGETFIVPVVIDDTRMDLADALPASFRRAQAIGAPNGLIDPSEADRLVELVRAFHRRQPAR
ncbi:toll/interleukin-1 receptor domain-containing protein [Paraburkholderia sp. SIMBA_049]